MAAMLSSWGWLARRRQGFVLWNSWRSARSKTEGQQGLRKEPLRKPETPVGRLDNPQQEPVGKDPLERFPDDINPVTKEKNGPRGPEPTRYGDWERRGRCIDF
ncbi:succinate dehydrogenase assembly factor 4, mitochondrial [Carcharodon carcharias]|uniref:succinate dehydrogenase assembly factor 4, mitochondrial n=1 Tax=Carcharodon carcharias TaxID=13397 RepID=UPI001B7DA701|nr:succinate dehydrogenase assembly factor 4, mitochondrial [Carcharodon carcharias]